MATITTPIETRQRSIIERNARVIAGVGFGIIVLLLLIPWLTFEKDEESLQGITIAFGQPDQGGGDRPSAQSEAPIPEASEPEPTPPSEPEYVPPVEPTPPVEPAPAPTENLTTNDNSKELALQKEKERKEREEKRRKQEEERKERDRKRKEQERIAEEKRKEQERIAEEKRKEEERKAAEAKALEDKKNQYSGAFGGGNGGGNDNGGGNEGQPTGDPNASNVSGVGGGSGVVNGFGNRGFRSPGPPKLTQQVYGKIAVKVCVDERGNVVSAEATQAGSTSTNSYLRKLAEDNAKKYRFDSSGLDKQCGTITYTFKPQ